MGKKGNRFKLSVPVVLTGISLALHLPVLYWLVFRHWAEPDKSSIGIIPLAVSLCWLAIGWRNLENSKPKYPAAGALMLGFGFWLWLVNQAAEPTIQQGHSLAFVLAGLIWLYGGERKLIRLWFPLAYLLLAFPLPGLLENQFSFMLRLWSAKLAGFFISLFGWPGEVVGTSIIGPQFSFDVAPACSGLKTTYAFLVMGVLMARLLHKNNFWFAVQVLIIPAATLLANSLRITAIGGIGHHYGLEATKGLAHEGSGIVFFLVFFFLFTFLGKWLAKRHNPAEASPLDTQPSAAAILARPPATSVACHAVVLVVALSLAGNLVLRKKETQPPPIHNLSYLLNGWVGTDAPLDHGEVLVFGNSQVKKRVYNKGGSSIELLSNSSHSYHLNLRDPVNCYLAKGWHVLGNNVSNLQAGNKTIPVRRVKLESKPDNSDSASALAAIYWFQADNGDYAASSMGLTKISFRDRLLFRPKPAWTLFALATPWRESDSKTWEALEDLAAAIQKDLDSTVKQN